MTKSQAWPFVAPFFFFMAFLAVEGFFPDQHYALYPFKTILVAAVIAWYWRLLPPLRPSAPMLSVAVGILGILLWIGFAPWAIRLDVFLEELFNHAVSSIELDSWQMEVEQLSPIGRNPFQLYPANEAWVLFGFRLTGITLCVPVMEELFWRGFLMRWLIKEDFTSVPLGTYQPFSFWITTACFAAVHGAEWLLAVVVGVLYGAWFVRTKSLGNIMLAHGVTNLLLALYCLTTNDWHFLSIMTPASSLK
jgi:membrane protease YdiL (CAAX protease family)